MRLVLILTGRRMSAQRLEELLGRNGAFGLIEGEHPETFPVVFSSIGLEKPLGFVLRDHPVHDNAVVENAAITERLPPVKLERGYGGQGACYGIAAELEKLGNRVVRPGGHGAQHMNSEKR